MKDLRGRLTPFRFGCLTNKRSRSPCRTRLIGTSLAKDQCRRVQRRRRDVEEAVDETRAPIGTSVKT